MQLRIRTLITSLTTFFLPLAARADLPDMEDPSRGKGDGIMETLQNYGYDIVILMSLAICAVGFQVVANSCIGTYAEIQNGRKQWKDLGALLGSALCVLAGGRVMSRLKRGRPDIWLYQAISAFVARRGFGDQRLVQQSAVWTIRRCEK